MNRRVWLPLCLLLVLSPVLSFGQGDISVVSEGYGVSRDDALLAAKREALQEGIGTLLISETEIRNFSLKRDMVLSRTIGAVHSYTILGERQEGKTYFVKISANLSEAEICQGLAAMKILLEFMDKPRLMVVVKEEAGRDAENTIIDYLGGKGFTVVDAAKVGTLMAQDDALLKAAIGGDDMAAAQLGADNGADYVLIGKVKKAIMNSQILEKTGMVSGQATITARVINARSATVVSSVSASAGAAHVSAEMAQDVAARKVAQKLMNHELFEQMVASFQVQVQKHKLVGVTFRNVEDFHARQDINTLVTGLGNVSVHSRSFRDGHLVVSVLYEGNIGDFCQRLNGKTVGGKKLAVMEVAASRVVVVLH